MTLNYLKKYNKIRQRKQESEKKHKTNKNLTN